MVIDLKDCMALKSHKDCKEAATAGVGDGRQDWDGGRAQRGLVGHGKEIYVLFNVYPKMPLKSALQWDDKITLLINWREAQAD